MKINYQSDFDFLYTPIDCRGETVMFPAAGVDWRVEFRTRDHCRTFTVSCVGGSCTNCFNDNGRIHVVAKDHGLSPGRLVGTMTLLNPNRTYPGGIQRIVDRQPVGIELVNGSACYDDPSPSADVVIPIVAVDGRQPLPFRFGVVGDNPAPGHPVFAREYGRFFRPVKDHNAEEIDPADGPYNIYAPDGRVIANTDRLFICGHTVYRYTGRELVNVAIEQNPNQRLVSRTPSINAHPGLVYLDRGFIRLPIHRGLNRVPINDLYFKLEAGGIVPLEKVVSDINIGDPYDGTNIPAEIVDGHVVFSVGNYVVSHRLRAWVEISELRGTNDGRVNNSYIAVRYDAGRRKIFYRVDRLPRHEMDAPTIGEALSVIEFGNASDDSDQCFVACHNSWYQLEVWYRRRHGKGRISENKNGKLRHMHHDRQWRWRKGEEHFLNCHYCLLRIRRATGKNRSKWTYIHFNVKKHEMRLATQVRT